MTGDANVREELMLLTDVDGFRRARTGGQNGDGNLGARGAGHPQ
jgi:hypothetical protein